MTHAGSMHSTMPTTDMLLPAQTFDAHEDAILWFSEAHPFDYESPDEQV
ncbi:MAG: hypothetical protein QM754_13865 [Tepidisphaeraceae bacterium]